MKTFQYKVNWRSSIPYTGKILMTDFGGSEEHSTFTTILILLKIKCLNWAQYTPIIPAG